MRSRVRVSAARAAVGSMLRVYSSLNARRPAEDSGCFLPRMRFNSVDLCTIAHSFGVLAIGGIPIEL